MVINATLIWAQALISVIAQSTYSVTLIAQRIATKLISTPQRPDIVSMIVNPSETTTLNEQQCATPVLCRTTAGMTMGHITTQA
jgi:hypothetical protein